METAVSFSIPAEEIHDRISSNGHGSDERARKAESTTPVLRASKIRRALGRKYHRYGLKGLAAKWGRKRPNALGGARSRDGQPRNPTQRGECEAVLVKSGLKLSDRRALRPRWWIRRPWPARDDGFVPPCRIPGPARHPARHGRQMLQAMSLLPVSRTSLHDRGWPGTASHAWHESNASRMPVPLHHPHRPPCQWQGKRKHTSPASLANLPFRRAALALGYIDGMAEPLVRPDGRQWGFNSSSRGIGPRQRGSA
jgi:hypothetical protein